MTSSTACWQTRSRRRSRAHHDGLPTRSRWPGAGGCGPGAAAPAGRSRLISSTLHTSRWSGPRGREASRPAAGGRAGRRSLSEEVRQLAGFEAVVRLLDPRSGGESQVPPPSNRDADTAASLSLTASVSPTAMVRRSRAPAVLARLTRIRNSQVRKEERPSNPPMPRSTPTQVSWTTSSATATFGTNEHASRSIAAWCRCTRVTNARSSPARSAASSCVSVPESTADSLGPPVDGSRRRAAEPPAGRGELRSGRRRCPRRRPRRPRSRCRRR